MGTDISLFAEKRVADSWHAVPEPTPDPASGLLMPVEPFDVGRPYELFVLLSGRHVWAMAPVELPATFAPRGLAEDMNPVYAQWLPKWYEGDREGGGWGATWLELRELIDLDWDQKVRCRAHVKAPHAKLFRPDEGFPTAFPKTEMLYHGPCHPPPAGAVQVTWSISLRDYVGCSTWFIEQLSALAPGQEVRIMYWFNS
jgi:hypothetical protein